MPLTTALEICEITKRFLGVIALEKVSFSVERAQVHALLGENGAGKSTLLKVLTGVYQPNGGKIRVQGRQVHLSQPRDARAAGITFVPQEIAVVPKLSIGRNVLLGLETGIWSRGRLSRDEYRQVMQAFAKIGLDADPETPAQELSVPQLRLAQISRCLHSAGDIVLLDEPTAALSEPDAAKLLDNIELLRLEGKAIVYVTHRLSEVMKLADKVTVLRDGRVCSDFRRPLDRTTIVEAMTKQHAAPKTPTRPLTNRRPHAAIEAEQLSIDRWVEDVSLTVKAGSVVGIAGVQGSGHGQLLWGLANAMPRRTGTVRVNGALQTSRALKSMYDAGVLLVPADRRGAAIVPQRSVAENIVVSRRIEPKVDTRGLRKPAAEIRLANGLIERFDIRPRTSLAHVGLLSGGNQQKVVVARAIASRPSVLLIEEPTQGIDINARAEVHALLRRTAEETGCAVIVASSEFEELIEICSTIHVMRLGRLVHSFVDITPTYREILDHALP